MAIKKTVTTVHGLVAPDAYHRVEGLRLEGKDEITFQVRSYTDPTGPFFSEMAVSSPARETRLSMKGRDNEQ